MKYRKTISAITATIFLLVIMAGAYDRLSAQSAATDEISSLLKQADEAYQNGNFTLAIEKYQKVMEVLNNKKELAKTKQALIQTMISLALTYFTIRENEKAQKQLEDLITLNPNYELDPEIYTPKFIDMFKNVQKNLLGKITIVTTPPGCIIFLNGSKMGQSPLTLERCLKGKYQLKAELKGYGGVSQDIEIKPGLENRQELTLETEHAVVEKKLGKPLPVLKKRKSGLPG